MSQCCFKQREGGGGGPREMERGEREREKEGEKQEEGRELADPHMFCHYTA